MTISNLIWVEGPLHPDMFDEDTPIWYPISLTIPVESSVDQYYLDLPNRENDEECTSIQEKIADTVYVAERDKDGNRHINQHKAPYVFYTPDSLGDYISIDDKKLKKHQFNTYRKFKAQKRNYQERGYTLYESDIDPSFRLLEEQYPNDDELPKLNTGILDIEVDYDSKIGWANPNNPYAPINAVTLYDKFNQVSYTLALAPKSLTIEEAKELLANDSDEFGSMTEDDGYFVCKDEKELLLCLLDLLEPIDVITGWNSEFYDLPYLVARIRIVLGHESISVIQDEYRSEEGFRPGFMSHEHLKKLNLFPMLPRMRMVERFGKLEPTFDMFGRIHLDYLALYRKFTFEELHSYTLDFVLQREVGETKVAYTGTLEELYNNDFRTFVAYNRQDVMGLSRMDDKLGMIQLANQMVHMAGVTFDKVTGSVTIIEQAILRRLHRDGIICFDKVEHESKGGIPGAFVVDPVAGMYKWVCSFDINSLYPSVIRSLNISPEVIVGQFDTPHTDELFALYLKEFLGDEPNPTQNKLKAANQYAWGKFTGVLEYHMIIDGDTEHDLTLRIEGTDEDYTMTGAEWKEMLDENGWSISGRGTVFHNEHEGIVSKCLSTWYADRVLSKNEAKKYGKLQEDEKDADKLAEYKELETYHDMVQLVKKIFLNSTYGAYLNRFFRFYDPRLGASVTLSGRVITKHMCKQSSEELTGNYEFDRNAVIYGDTDSAYCTMDWHMKQNGIEETVENAIELADRVGENVNTTFPSFMSDNFMVTEDQGAIIEAGREVVALHGMFKAVKKRYALHVVDLEGKKVDKMKIMGMETRRSDTPKMIQEFLERALEMTVKEQVTHEELRTYVDDFRSKFRALKPWEKGTPCRVSNLTVNQRKIQSYNRGVAAGYVGLKKPFYPLLCYRSKQYQYDDGRRK